MTRNGFRAAGSTRIVWNLIFVGYLLFFVAAISFAVDKLLFSDAVGAFKVLCIFIVIILGSNLAAQAYKYTR